MRLAQRSIGLLQGVNMSQLKAIEMVMISTDGQAYVKVHRYLGQ
jgi:hypothetical protein